MCPHCPIACAQVEYYGALTPLKQLASIAVPDASTLLVSPFDKGALKEIEKAINSSDIGLNPNNDGQNIRLNIPAMTQVRPVGTAAVAVIGSGVRPCAAGLVHVDVAWPQPRVCSVVLVPKLASCSGTRVEM